MTVIYSFIEQILSPNFVQGSVHESNTNMNQAQNLPSRSLQTRKGENICPQTAKMQVSKMVNIIKL